MRLKIVIFQRNTFTAHSYVFGLAFFECPGPYFWRPLLTFSLHGWVYMNCLFWTHFRSSLLSLQKIASANPSCKTISVTWNLLFWCWPIRSKDRIRLEWVRSRPRALKRLGFRRELPNTLWNVNFATITRFPATLNADFFIKQLLLKLCLWRGPLVSLYKIR